MSNYSPRRRQHQGKRRNPNFHFYAPGNIDLDEFLPPGLQKYRWEALYLIHRIVVGRNRFRGDERGYVSLKIEYLRRVIPGRVLPQLIQHLVAAEVIECDNWYVKGKKAKGYRLAPKYSKAKTKRITCENSKVRRKLNTLAERARSRISLDVHKYLFFWLQQLEIDADQARNILDQADLSEARRANIAHNIDRLVEQDWHFSFDPFGRVHTNLTNFSSRVRPALHLEGQRLVEIDISNSQPLFLGLLVLNYRSQGNKLLDYKTFSPKSELLPSSSSLLPPTLRITMCRMLQEVTGYGVEDNRQKLAADEQKYLALCEAGRLYEFLQDSFEQRHVSRKVFKQQFFSIIYGPNNYQPEFRQLFREEFPELSKVIHRHKTRKPQYLAHLMQWYESSFVINTVCRRLMTDHPDIPVFTIHDSLLTTPQHADRVEAVMQEEFGSIGLAPKLKIKRHAPPSATMPAEIYQEAAGGPQIQNAIFESSGSQN